MDDTRDKQQGWPGHPPGEVPTKAHIDALDQAWGIIANASEGEWSRQTPEWVAAAEEWRDRVWHPALSAYVDAHPEKVMERVFGEEEPGADSAR